MSRWYFYLERRARAPVMVRATRRPSDKTVPRSGTWVLYEWDGKQWALAAFPEITWPILKTLVFVGPVYDETIT